MRIAEVEAMVALGDDDRVTARGREVEVVRVGHRDRRPFRLRRHRVDRREAVPLVVVDIERLQIVRGRHVLRQAADRVVRDDAVRVRVDHVDRVAAAVGGVDPFGHAADRRAQHPRTVVRVDVRGRSRGSCGRGNERGDPPGRRRVSSAGEDDSVSDRRGG